MKQTLNLNFSQRLVMTPQLKQSLRLLQLSSLDLEQELQQQLDSNPLLERDDLTTSTLDGEATDQATDDRLTVGSNPYESNSENENPVTAVTTDPNLVENDDAVYQENQGAGIAPEQDLYSNWDNQSTSNHTPTQSANQDNDFEFTQFVSKQETLFEHLYWQIQMTTLSVRDKSIARSILHSLDDEGYLTCELKEIKDLFSSDLDIELDEVNAVLSLIKTLDPVGAGARNLTERLLLLLERTPENTPNRNTAKEIISNHLDLVAKHNLAALKKALNIDEDTLAASLGLITNLNPRIATEFKSEQLDYVVPDTIVRQVGNQWRAFINPNNQSKLRINQLYADMLKSDIDESESEYIQSNLLQAKMFIKGLMSRYDTLLLVSQAIVERQQAFFHQGDHAMQPMVLQDIANELDMHESTISRATSGKYLLSNRGVYELKYFFSSALTSTDGSTTSSTAIRSLIKKMVDDEPKEKPLSDNKIAKMLEQQGHIVARRTVAKYRENMHIAPSSQRKSLI